jgi:lipopolysaccharide export system protein LptA
MACNFRAVMSTAIPDPTRPPPRAPSIAIRGGTPGAGRWRVTAALLASLVAGPAIGPAFAERADRGKPLSVEADAGRYDDAKQVGLFTGNVVITKGSIVLRAAQVEVRQTPDGHQSSVATGTADTPARFRQKREGVDEHIEGEAERIEYDSRADTVRFVNRAVLRRYRGTVVADEASGQLITFDNAASVYSVSGGSAANGGRVRAVLSPRGDDAPPAGSAPLPATRP